MVFVVSKWNGKYGPLNEVTTMKNTDRNLFKELSRTQRYALILNSYPSQRDDFPGLTLSRNSFVLM